MKHPPTKWILIGAALLAVIAASLAFGWPAIREWRAAKLAGDASRSLEDGDVQLAEKTARAAFLISSSQPDVLRVLARLYETLGHAQALEFYTLLETRGLLTTSDQLGRARILLKLGRVAEAAKLIQETTPDEETRIDWLLAHADCEQMLGNAEGALAALEEASRASSRPEVRLRYLTLALAAAPAKRAAVLEELRGLAIPGDATSSMALEILARVPGEDPAWLLERLRALPAPPTLKIRLLTADLSLRIPDAPRLTILQELVKQYRDASPEERRTVIVWLNQRNGADLALDLLPPEEALKRNDLLLARLDSLATLGRWEEVESQVTASQLPEPVKRLFLGRAYQETDRHSLAEISYQQAARLVPRDPKILSYVAQYLERVNHPELAEIVWMKLGNIPAQSREALQNVARLQRAKKDIQAYAATLDKLASTWPGWSQYRIEQLYLRLVLEQASDADRAEAESYETKYPRDPAAMVVCALLRLQEGRPKDALRVIAPLEPHLAQLPPNFLLVIAMTYRASADPRADEITIDPSILFPEENVLAHNL